MNRRIFLKTTFIALTGTPSLCAQEPEESAKVLLPGLHPGTATTQYDFAPWHDINGGILTAKDIEDKYLLVYGGYLECTGVCPGAAASIVGAMKALKKDNPALAKKIIPVIIMIKNNPGDTLQSAQARAHKWQTEGLQSNETNIRVLVAEDQNILDQYMNTFGIQIASGTDGQLNHSGWAYLFDEHGNWQTLLPTQKGAQKLLEKLEAQIKNRGPSPDPGL